MPMKIVTNAQARACDKMEKYTPLILFLNVAKPTINASRSGSPATASIASGKEAKGFQKAGRDVSPPVTMNSGSALPHASSFRYIAIA